MVGLMRMIVEKDHFAKMPEVLTFFIDKALEEKKIGIAYVTTPMEVTDAQKKQIEDRLLETTAYQSFRMHYAVDADLIGRDGNPYWGSRCGQQCAHQDLRTIERIIQNTVESR